jgi:hypothetical protein
MNFPKPQIPSGLLRDMTRIVINTVRDAERGGQWIPEGKSAKSIFKGIVLPINNEDLKYLDEGTYTQNMQKLYTNGPQVGVGAQFIDSADGSIYTITQELNYGPTHPLKRYVVEKKGVANSHDYR